MTQQGALGLLVYVGFVLQASAGTWTLSPAMLPPFLPLAAAVCCLHAGRSAAIGWAVILGLCWGALSRGPMGAHVLGLVVLTTLVRLLTSRTLGRSFLASTVFIVVFLGVALMADRLYRHFAVVPVDHLSQAVILDASRAAAGMLVYVGVRGLWQLGVRLSRELPLRLRPFRWSEPRWAR